MDLPQLFQMTDASAKTIAASQSVEERDVGCEAIAA
jgi:hypothetical protein